jgi:predicted dehydrogenase
MTTPKATPNRRKFIQASTVAASAVLTLSAKSYAEVRGANERLGIAFLGCGGRAQSHINLISKLATTHPVTAVGVCDVWDGHEETYTQTFAGKSTERRYSQGLYPSAVRAGLDPQDKARVVKDYRRLLDRPDVDIVCISTPDHWHARMSLDAIAAGKDVYVEKPMTRTPAEAVAVTDAANKHNRIVCVGVQGMSDPSWRTAAELIQKGDLGHVAQLQAGVFRNDIRGQWRFYRTLDQMNPKTIAWDLFLGHRFEVNGVKLSPPPSALPFDRKTFAQWRCLSAFSSGPISDLLIHPATKLLAATGLRFPSRVIGAGGLFLERDGRDVPDVATVIADFAEGTQMLLTATTISGYPMEEVIRGRIGNVKFVRGGVQLFRDEPEKAGILPQRLDRTLEPTERFEVDAPRNETEAMWLHFLDCVRRRDRNTLCPPELGAAAVTLLAMGWESCRMGLALTWDRERRGVQPATAGMVRVG